MKKKGLPGPLFMDAVFLELAIQDFARGGSQMFRVVGEKCMELRNGRSRIQRLLDKHPIEINAAILQGEAMIEKVGFEL